MRFQYINSYIKYYLIFLLYLLVLNSTEIFASTNEKLLSGKAEKSEIHPFKVYPFEIPKQHSQKFKHYRENWDRVTGFEYSGLHWDQFIAIFINQDKNIFQHNFVNYLRQLEEDDDEDEDEDEEDENKNQATSKHSRFKTYKPGTIVLKENYASHDGRPTTPLTLTIMIKHQAGYDPDGGDWEYMQVDPKGNTILIGNGHDPLVKKICSDCHANVKERDYIFSTFYSIKPDENGSLNNNTK